MISVTRIVRLTMRVARWAEPHVKEWHRQRHLNRTEGQRHLDSHNWAEAEKHFTLALAERRHSKQRQCELLLNLEQAQRRQRKLGELEQGRYPEAERSIAEILRTEQAESRPDGARLARCYRKLGTARLKSERQAEAMEAFRQAADLSERAFGAAHAETAQSFAELGMLHRQHGEHTQAQVFLRRALDIHRGASGLDSHEATQGLYQLAA